MRRARQFGSPSQLAPLPAMARAALSVVYAHERDGELAELRRRVGEVAAERSAARWATLCRAGVRLCANLDMFHSEITVRRLVADYIAEEKWCVAEGVVSEGDRFNPAPGRLNFNVNVHDVPLHIEGLLVNHIAGDFMDGEWHPLQHYLKLTAECGVYRPSEGLFYQGSAPPRAAEEYSVWE